MARTGRPSKFNQDIADRICDEIAGGKSLRRICGAEDMPSTSTVCLWLSQHKEFSEQYARARDIQADYLIDEAYQIIDDGSRDEYQLDDGSKRTDHNHIQRARAQMQLRQWHAARLAPKKYGDRMINEHTGADGGPMEHRTVPPVDAPPQETREEWLARKAKEQADRSKDVH